MSEPSDVFAPLRIKRVVRETSDAVSLVFDVPKDCSHRFRYEAGQFLTLRVVVAGDHHRRCYSMSSSPHNGDELQITVKRDPGGVVSNWLNDRATAGDEIDAAPPEGRFVLGEEDRDVVAFAGGSGITPIHSLIGSALAGTRRRIRLFYANRSRDAVIFAESIAALADANQDRLTVRHHIDEVDGDVPAEAIVSFIAAPAMRTTTSAGPGPSWTPWKPPSCRRDGCGNVFTWNGSTSRWLPTPAQRRRVPTKSPSNSTVARRRCSTGRATHCCRWREPPVCGRRRRVKPARVEHVWHESSKAAREC